MSGAGTGLPTLGVYVHWPYCARICPYCDFNVVRARGRADQAEKLVDAVIADLETQAAMIGPRRLVSIFFGGGTPSLMRPEATAQIIERVRTLWPGPGPIEVTLEANPTDAEAGRFQAFHAAGVDRLSLGVQAFDDGALAFLGRAHDAAETRRAIETAARMFPRLSLDLIYALPGQTAESWSDSLRRAAGTGAEHLSPYQLTIEAGTPFDRAVRRGRFRPADEDAGADLYDITQSTLEALGLHAYEVSNHARGPAAQARHNLVYWRGEDYVGAGPGAHGRLTRPDGVRLAAEAEARIGDYIGRVEREGSGSVFTPMTDLDRAEERLLMGLRTDEGAPLEALSPLPLSALPDLVDTGHLSLSEGRLVATAAGRPVLDHLIRRLIVA